MEKHFLNLSSQLKSEKTRILILSVSRCRQLYVLTLQSFMITEVMQDVLQVVFSGQEMRSLYYHHYSTRRLKALMFWEKHFQKQLQAIRLRYHSRTRLI